MNVLDDALFPKIGESYSGAEETLAKLGYAPNCKHSVRGVPLRAA
jgi:hypothetical protein